MLGSGQKILRGYDGVGGGVNFVEAGPWEPIPWGAGECKYTDHSLMTH